MAYVRPRVQIAQEFTQQPVFSSEPLAAFILGPQYQLFRYDHVDEKALISIGAYNPASDEAFNYPSQPVGSTVDQAYVKLFMDNAQALYLQDDIGSGSTIAHVAGYTNRIRSSSLVFQTANGYNRSSSLYNRDVQVGDVVVVDDGAGSSLTTKVAGLVADMSTPSAGSFVAASGNVATQSEDITNSPTYTGPGSPPVSITPANSTSAYAGHLGLAVVSDTYTVTVTTGGVLTAARFSISSAAGVFATKTNVALATGVLDIDTDTDLGNGVSITFSGIGTFIVGNQWTLEVDAVVSTATATITGTYTGSADLTYIVTVTRGGPFFDGTNDSVCARATITSTDIDSDGPFDVQLSSAFPLGTHDLDLAFTAGNGGHGLIVGDIYTVGPVVASAAVQVRTLVLQDNLTSAQIAAGDLNLKLYLVKNGLEISEIRSLTANTINWSTTAQQITVKSGIIIHDDLIQSGGIFVDLPLLTGNMFVQHRDLMITNINSIGSISDIALIPAQIGQVDPDNPLAQGVYEALLNAAGVTVYYVGVGSDDQTGYSAALELAKKNSNVYGLVPMTFDKTIQDLIISHVNAMSTPINAKWRVSWISRPLQTSTLLYDVKPNLSNWTGTITSDPQSLSTIYDYVTVSGASFLTDGVRPGDELFINFRLDASGNVIHDTYTVAQVRTETNLVIATPLVAPIVTAIKVQVNRVYTKDEQINLLAAEAVAYKNRRVRVVFPDTFKTGSITKPGYFAAASMAGLRSGVVPHQGLTNIEILGMTDLSESLFEFTSDQLDNLAGNGVWIIQQDSIGATPYVRHQLTTDVSSLNTVEDSITTNVDSISYGLQSALAPFIGVFNRNNESIAMIRFAIERELKFRQTNTFTIKAGNQLLSFDIQSLAPDPTFNDRINANIVLGVPFPINFINVTLIV